MELPFHLRTLPPEALEILRFYYRSGDSYAHADSITETTGLSDRGFGKAIRRLVTKGYLVMDGEQRYRLTEPGYRAVKELGEAEGDDYFDFDSLQAVPVVEDVDSWAVEVAEEGDSLPVDVVADTGAWAVEVEDEDDEDDESEELDEDSDAVYATAEDDEDESEELDEDDESEELEDSDAVDVVAEDDQSSGETVVSTVVTRRLVLALPQRLVAGQEVTVYAGFEPAETDAFAEPVNALLRLTVVNGEPARAQDAPLALGADAARRQFMVTPGRYTKMRVRVEVFQVDGDEDDEIIINAGGLYVDADVVQEADGASPFTAYGADTRFMIAG